jgi:hypothetical protein
MAKSRPAVQVGHWSLIIDADEMFVYPHYERITLRQLCTFLDRNSFDAMDTLLLDMYPNLPLSRIRYERGSDPLSIASWFDLPSYTKLESEPMYLDDWSIYYKGPERLKGGVRKRMFNVVRYLSKVSLVKFNQSLFLTEGTHFLKGGRFANISGALLHFKYLDDFAMNVKREIDERRRDKFNGKEYKAYWDTINAKPTALNLYSGYSQCILEIASS